MNTTEPGASTSSAGFGVLGGLAYAGGRTGSPVCDADSLLQLHGLWHLSTAAAAGLWATALWPTVGVDEP